MVYVPQFAKSTTLAALMSAAEVTSATLASAVFTNFTADFLVFDYDVPAKREVVKCTVTGTAISSITRAQEGTSAVEHAIGAKVGYNFLPSHYTALTDFVGARARLDSVLTTTVSGAVTKLALDVETYDIGGNFASNKFTAPVNGYYLICGRVEYGNVATADRVFQALAYKNGAGVTSSSVHSATTVAVSPQFSDVLYLAATDYIELYYYHNDATTVDINGNDAAATFLSVTLLKAV